MSVSKECGWVRDGGDGRRWLERAKNNQDDAYFTNIACVLIRTCVLICRLSGLCPVMYYWIKSDRLGIWASILKPKRESPPNNTWGPPYLGRLILGMHFAVHTPVSLLESSNVWSWRASRFLSLQSLHFLYFCHVKRQENSQGTLVVGGLELTSS